MNQDHPLFGGGLQKIFRPKKAGELMLTEEKNEEKRPQFTFSSEVETVPKRHQGIRPCRRFDEPKTLSVFEQIEADCKVMSSSLRVMMNRLGEISAAAKTCRWLVETFNTPLSLEDSEVQRLEKAKLGLVVSLDAIHRIMAKRPPMVIENDEALKEWDDIAPLYRDIQAVVDGGSLYVKTPPLFNRNRHWGSHAKTDYFATFSPVVERKVRRVLSDLPYFLDHNVTMIAVYPNDNQPIVDTDNLDTKSVVDAIVGNLPGADYGENCTFFSASIRSEALPEGVYFTVSEGFAKVPDFEENIQKLDSLFGRRDP